LSCSSVWWLVVVVCIVIAARCGRELFFGLRRRTDFVLVQGDQVANDAVIELERALVLGERRGLGGEFGDDILAVLLPTDGVGELSATPMGDLGLLFCREQSVKAVD